MKTHYINKCQLIVKNAHLAEVYTQDSDVGIVFEGVDSIKRAVYFITGKYMSLEEAFLLNLKKGYVSHQNDIKVLN